MTNLNKLKELSTMDKEIINNFKVFNKFIYNNINRKKWKN